MPIILNDAKTLITLHTCRSTYQMKVDELGTLLHTYYGNRIDAVDMSYRMGFLLRGFSGSPHEKGKTSPGYSLDTLPQEYSCFGTGDYRASALRMENFDGSQAVQLRVTGLDVLPGKYGLESLPAVHGSEEQSETLIVHMEDSYSGLKVDLQYGILPELDVICRAARITNGGDTPVVLRKAASMSLDWISGDFDCM